MNNIIGLAELHRLSIKSMLILFCFMLSMSIFIVADAAELTKKVIVTTSIERDSNPILSETDTNPTTIYTLLPQFSLALDDDFNHWYLDAAINYQEHSNENVLVDRQDPRLTAGWDRTYASGKYGVRLNYIQNSAILVELRGAGVFNNIDNNQRVKTIGANWLHNIDNRWSVLTDASYSDVLFTQPGTFLNFRTSDIRSKLLYENSEKLTTSLLLGYSHLRPERVFKPTDLVRLRAGADYLMTESLTLSSYAGLFKLGGNQRDTDWEAGFKLGYVNERSNYSAEANRENVVNGIGGFQIADTYALRWLFTRTAADRFGLDYALSKTKEDRQTGLIPIEFRQTGAFYERDLTNKWKTRFYASFRELETETTNSHGNLIGISLTYDTLSF